MKSLACTCCLILFASAAAAEPPKAAAASKEVAGVQALVKRSLLTPLAKREQERSKYSRVAMPPAERRVRVLGASASRDDKGEEFFSFAIDARYGLDDDEPWVKGAFVGCAYPKDGAIFIKRGDAYQPASALLGKRGELPRSSVCRPAGDAVVEAAEHPARS